MRVLKKDYLRLIVTALFPLILTLFTSFMLSKTLRISFFDNDTKKNKVSEILNFEKDFFQTTNKLMNSQDSNLINIETLKKIFNSIDRKANGRLFNYGFINVLEDYSVHLITESKQINKDNFQLIITLINEELKSEPFNQLKLEQKRILLNLTKALNKNDIEIGMYNLNELNDIIRIQNEYEKKLEKQISWSIPLAIAGIILTLTFGVFSFIKSVTKRGTLMINETPANKRVGSSVSWCSFSEPSGSGFRLFVLA